MQPAAMYHSPAVARPTLEKVKSLAQECGFDLPEEDIKIYHELIGANLKSYDRVAQLPEVKLPVKYPRTPGYRPPEEENKYNAWYYKTDIKGAPGGKLHGKRIAIKDNTNVAGVPMMNGTKLLEGYIPDTDATVVTRILDAGGHIVGKAVCEPLCFSGGGHLADSGPVLNPLDVTRITGASSSGSGALVAAGEVDMATGGDQGGSIRMPAAWCGIVGLKPTHGLVPYTGIMPIERTIDHCGPMTRTVYDCALMLEVIAGYDEGRDHRQRPDVVVPEYTKELDKPVSGLKVGLMKEGFDNCSKEISAFVRQAANRLEQAGITLHDCSVPCHEDTLHCWTCIGLDGTYTSYDLAGYDPGVKGYYDTPLLDHFTMAQRCRPNDVPMTCKTFYMMCKYLKDNYSLRFYSKARNVLPGLIAQYDKALQEYDVLIMPTLPYMPPKIPHAGVDLKTNTDTALGMIKNTAPFDATGHPALSINAGFLDNLPVGMMIIGKHYDESTVLRVANAFEKIREA